MKTLSALFLTAMVLTGCVQIEGQLNVSKEVKLKTSKGQTRTIAVGTYSAEVKPGKKKITLSLNDSDDKYEFSVPKNSIPSNGDFYFKSATVGQPVDLSGTVKTVLTDSDRRQTTQSCTYSLPVQICSTGPNGQVFCTVHYQTYPGTQWIQYFDRKTQKDISLSISAAGSNDVLGVFIGDVSWVDRIVISEGLCR